jgi:hypothetical protein
MYHALAEGAATESGVMPFRNSLSKPPMKAVPAGEGQAVAVDAHSTLISEKITNTCISTDSMFLLRTRPP